jgi:hypothetical protein
MVHISELNQQTTKIDWADLATAWIGIDRVDENQSYGVTGQNLSTVFGEVFAAKAPMPTSNVTVATGVAVGYACEGNGLNSVAMGRSTVTSGSTSTVVGQTVQNTVDYVWEGGYWSDNLTRESAIRAHPNGQIAVTIIDSQTPPTDGGATLGSEADGTLPRGMASLRIDGNNVYLDYNNAGTINSYQLIAGIPVP